MPPKAFSLSGQTHKHDSHQWVKRSTGAETKKKTGQGTAEAHLLRVCREREVHLIKVDLVCPEALEGGVEGVTHRLCSKAEATTQQHVCPWYGEVLAGDHYRAAFEPL